MWLPQPGSEEGVMWLPQPGSKEGVMWLPQPGSEEDVMWLPQSGSKEGVMWLPCLSLGGRLFAPMMSCSLDMKLLAVSHSTTYTLIFHRLDLLAATTDATVFAWAFNPHIS